MMMRSTALIAVFCMAIGFAPALLLMSGGALTVNADCPGDPDTPCDNGDVNADGDLDISDAVHLLSFLFLGGPEPVPFPPCEPTSCDSCCPSSQLPATGQTLCYDTAGNVIDCGSEEWPGQDGPSQAGCRMERRFEDNGDGTVTDNCTGLMWQQTQTMEDYNWQQALLYCADLELAGYDDWRLANIKELVSIADYGRLRPAADPVFLINSTVADRCWSSTTFSQSHNEAWIVNFFHGAVVHDLKTTLQGVRAVRTIQLDE